MPQGHSGQRLQAGGACLIPRQLVTTIASYITPPSSPVNSSARHVANDMSYLSEGVDDRGDHNLTIYENAQFFNAATLIKEDCWNG